MRGSGAGAVSAAAAERASWEQKSSRDIDFWRIRGHGANGVLRSMAGQARHVGLHQQTLAAKDSEDEPPFIGADIAGVLGNGRISGQGSTGNFEPLETSDYGMYGPAMTFREHDAVMRRLRDMVDDDGAPQDSNEYVSGAEDKSFLQPILKVPSDYGTLDYDLGKEGMYKYQ